MFIYCAWKYKKSEVLLLFCSSVSVVLVQIAQCYASQKEWYLISPAIADKQMDLLRLECSLGELDGLRYKDTAFVLEPTRSIIRPFGEWTKYRVIGTQKHTHLYTQSISQCLCFSPSIFFKYTYVSLFHPYELTFMLPPPWPAYHYVFWLGRSVEFLASH